jgi:hypothetical protein
MSLILARSVQRIPEVHQLDLIFLDPDFQAWISHGLYILDSPDNELLRAGAIHALAEAVDIIISKFQSDLRCSREQGHNFSTLETKSVSKSTKAVVPESVVIFRLAHLGSAWPPRFMKVLGSAL